MHFLLQNILTFTPPGFKQSLNVKFPDSRLAVCEKCKKNFKTKDMCRVRNSHTDPPWTTAYVCITVDDSCIAADGSYIDAPMTLRMVTWRPYAVRKPFHPKTPVCAACKRTNRTRSFCRDRHKHRQLPWCTVYVLLSALEQADPATIVAGASKPIAEDYQKESPRSEVSGDAKGDTKASDKDDSASESVPSEAKNSERSPVAKKVTPDSTSSFDVISSDADEIGDNINDIAESRTFLAKINCRGSSIHWLDLADLDDVAPPFASPDGSGAFPPPVTTPQHFDPSVAQAQYYAQVHYAQQQHQNALKSHYLFHLQQRQQQQFAQWQPQFAQPLVLPGVDHGLSLTTPADAAAPAAQQHRHQQEGNDANLQTAAVVIATPPSMQHQHQVQSLPWPSYKAPPQPGLLYSSPALLTADQSSEGNEEAFQPSQAAAASSGDSGGNSEDEPDCKRSRNA